MEDELEEQEVRGIDRKRMVTNIDYVIKNTHTNRNKITKIPMHAKKTILNKNELPNLRR